MLATVFMDKAMSTLMSLSILIGGFVLLYFAYRSESDGKTLIKKSIEKRNLFAEIILLLMAIIEGVNAATYAVKEGRDFGASIAMHVFGGVMSGIFAFGIYKQVTDVVIAIKDNEHPLIILKEIVDVLGTVILAVLFPIVNTYFVAIAAKHPQDFWNTLLFSWERIQSGSVFYSTVVGMGHVFACFLLSLNSFDTTLFKKKITTEPGGVIDPLPLASDSTDDDADSSTDDDADLSTPAPTDIIPYSRIPDRENLINYIRTHLSHRIDLDRLKHRMMIDERFTDKVAEFVEDSLKTREVWETEKEILRAATSELEKKRKLLERARQSYNFNPDSRVIQGLTSEIEHLEKQISFTSQKADVAEEEYDKKLDELGDYLDML